MGRLIQYQTGSEREVWDAPRWVFTKGVSVRSTEAAKRLGYGSRYGLMMHVDHFGLTVYRHPLTHHRYFLVSEIDRLEEIIKDLTPEQIADFKGDNGDGILQAVKKKQR